MSKGHGALERARQRVDPAWSTRELEAQLGRLEASVEARKRGPLARVLVISLLATCAAATFFMFDATTPGRESIATRSPAESSLTASPSVAPRVANTPSATAVDAATLGQLEEVGSPGQLDVLATEAPETRDLPLKRRSTRVKVASTVWHSLAREGRYQEAYRAMRGSEPDVRAEVDELLLAGDAARLSGHAREAIPFYRAALDKAGKDPRAHLAAFTLGRTLLNELHDPLRAAEAFARAYKTAPHGPLAEEALAREAESWQRAGDVTRAKAATERYQVAYPQGQLLRR